MSKLYPFQKKGVKRIIRFGGRALLADEMGLGKTIQALWYLKVRPKCLPALVVCPATGKWVWEGEARRHTRMRSLILNSKTPNRHLLESLPPITIINYDVVNWWTRWLGKAGYKTLILDECHYIKNRGAKRTKAVHRLGKKIPHVIALSGTPLTNRPSELYSTLKLILPERYPSYEAFAWKFCGRKYKPWGWDDSGATNISLLHKRLKKTCMIRRLKKHVLPELPPKTRIVVPLTIKKKREYLEAETHFIRWLKKKDPERAKRAAKAKGLVRLGYLKRLAAQLKMKAVLQWVDDFLEESNGKLVIFGIHKSILKTLYRRYKKQAVLVDGSVTGNKRKRAVKRFQHRKQTRLFIGNLEAAGTVITLTAATTAAFVELDFDPSKHIQAEDRIHRIGQSKRTFLYYLIAKNTIEADLCKTIQAKAKIISKTLDGETSKSNSLNIYNQLQEKICERQLL